MGVFNEIFTAIAMLLAGIAVFLLGVKFMSNGLDKGAGKAVKKVFVRMGDNRFANAAVGGGATAIIQSSTAVTVMTVGFVNTGVMTLLQATAVIMGANVGTTFTAFFAVMDGLPISPLFMMSGIVGIIFYLFGKRRKVKIAGEIIVGISLIFVGMHLMSRAFRGSDIVSNAFSRTFEVLAGTPVGPLLLTLVGAVFTALLQSSTAATSFAVLLAAQGILPLQASMFIILGANLGTALTAVLAGMGASTNAKRAGMVHLMYNIIGMVVFLPILWALQGQISSLLSVMAGGSRELAAAFFHLFYNIFLFAMLIGLTRPFAKMVTKMVKDKSGVANDGELKTAFIKTNMISPVPATDESFAIVKQAVLDETINIAKLAHENIAFAFRACLDYAKINKDKMVAVEQKINFSHKEIGQFLVKMNSSEGYMPKGEQRLAALHHVVSEIERMGDRAMDLGEVAIEMREQDIKLSEAAVLELEQLFETVSEMFAHCLEVFETRNFSGLEEVLDFRKEVGELKRALGFGHIERLNKGECSVEAGVHFYAMITALESIRNHLVNLAFSIKSTAGIQHEQFKQLTRENIKRRSAGKKVYW